MSRWDLRSQETSLNARGPIGTLIRTVGLAAGLGQRPARTPAGPAALETMERLEDRVLLAGDEPNFDQVFNTPNPLSPPAITLDGFGAGASVTGNGSSLVNPAGDTDVFRFTAPADDFVRIWADTIGTGSTLDGRVEVYTGTPGGAATLIASGSNNGTLTSGVFKDGWTGFVATAGTEYFVVVRADPLSGLGSIGDYTLRINALSTGFPALSAGNGEGSAAGSITRRGGDVVYKLVTGPEAGFNSLATFLATADPLDLDPRLDIYAADGTPLGGDSDTGNLTDAYFAARSAQNRTFYIRVRSDRIGDSATQPSTGAFTLNVDGIARNVALDPVTRRGNTPVLGLTSQNDTELLRFLSRGTGLSFVTINVGIPFALPDSAVRIYNDSGVQIGFNELTSAFSRLEIQLVGGQNYYVVVENFDGSGGGAFIVEVEAHHTFAPSQPIDDHATTPGTPYNPTSPPEFGTPLYTALQRVFELSTPVVWSTPQAAQTPDFQGLPAINTPDHSRVMIAEGTGRIHAPGDTDLFQFVVPVDMLGAFPGRSTRDNNPAPPPNSALWRPNYRPATSLQILAYGETLFNANVRIIDSNFRQIYPNQGVNGNVLTGPYSADPAGALDPASFPPELGPPAYPYGFAQGQPARIDIWAGEVYYLEVSGGGTGRYNFQMQTDAHTDDAAVSEFAPVPANVGEFEDAAEILIDPATGEGSNYTNAAGGGVIPLPDGSFLAVGGGAGLNREQLGRTRAMNLNGPPQQAPLISAGTGAAVLSPLRGTPGTRGRVIFQISDLGILQTATDTDLYQFRALYTGTAEIRINTTQLADEYFENIVQTEDGDPAPTSPPVIEEPTIKTKVYNSPLDSALRIFDNDQQEIAYNNDNGVTAGESDTRAVGDWAGRTFFRRDARVVIPVEAGKIYFVQVESGQLPNFNLTFPKVDWRHATGSYELLVNSMPDLQFGDDHINFTGVNIQATPIPVDLNNPSPTATLGSVNGQIENTLANPADSDLFTFFSPAEGAATVTVSTRLGDSFDRSLFIYDQAGTLISTVTATGTDDAVISFLANQGDRFYVRIEGSAPEQQGRYTVKVSGVPFEDDHASVPFFFGATDIPKDLYDYDGEETVTGTINNPGESDVFQFTTLAYDVATITINSLAPGLRPLVRVYEIGEDGAANPILMQIAHNTATSPGGTAEISFSVTAPPRTSGGNGDTFNTYYVVVSGANPDLDQGDYELTLSINNTTDDHPDATQYDIATEIPLDAGGIGTDSGRIELSDDTDLFRFTSSSQGLTIVQVTSPETSPLLVRVRIFDEDRQPVLDMVSGAAFVTGPDQPVSVAEFRFTAQRDKTYYVQVEGVTPFGTTFKTSNRGNYDVGITAPIPDDHPNLGEFPLATDIPLSTFTGDGSATGVVEVATDSDLFKFTAIVSGTMEVTIDTPSSQVNPVLRLFAQNTSEIGTALVGTNGSVVRTIPMVAGQTYYVLVSSDQAGSATTGGYAVTLNGTNPPQGPDDHANAGDYISATLISLSQLTGDATAAGNIELQTDTDLFYFNSLAGSPGGPRKAYVQVVTPGGSVLNAGVRIITLVNGNYTVIATDSAGGPGYNAAVEFDITDPNKKYWVEVDGLGGTGTYSVKIDTAPETFYLYYPEGFANSTIREYISIGNDNDFDVPYTIRLRYESGDPDLVISGVAQANRRGGVTISDGTNDPGSGVLFNKPYAIVIESGAFLAANISHYDFGNTLGEAFTGRTSSAWTFAEAERFPGSVRDFILYYNPNPHEVVVTLTAYQTDPDTGEVTTYAMSQTVGAFRRLGWNVNATSQLPLGKFAFTLTSANGPNAPLGASHIGIVAALSHNDLSTSIGYAVLGNPDGGGSTGVIPGLVSTSPASPHLTFFNSSATPATIGLVGKYIDSGLPDFVKNITLAPFESRSYDAVSLGLVENQTVGLRYDSNTRITALGGTDQNGASDVTQANTDAASSWFFGDAFINRLRAGTLYFENMYFYNPDTNPLPITLNFYFNTGTNTSYAFTVPPKDFAAVALHTLPQILNHAVFNYFAINAVAGRPFAMTMNHYDLVLSGGWGTKGAPLGLTTPLSTI